MRTNTLKFIKKNWHIALLLYYAILGLAYNYVNQHIVPKHFMYWPLLDDAIPFVKEMIIPYVIWYAYIFFPFAYFALFEKESYFNLSLFLYLGMTISYIVFFVYPNGQNLRPVIEPTDIFLKTIHRIYETDKPTNSAPSMHVINTIAVHISLIKSKSLNNKKWITCSSFVLAILICVSTVMIKQHSVIDVFAGLLVSLIVYLFIYSNKTQQFIKKISA